VVVPALFGQARGLGLILVIDGEIDHNLSLEAASPPSKREV